MLHKQYTSKSMKNQYFHAPTNFRGQMEARKAVEYAESLGEDWATSDAQ